MITNLKISLRALFLLIVISGSTFFGCSRTPKVPKDVIPVPAMVMVLTELHIADARLGDIRLRADSLQNLSKRYKSDILDRFGYTPEDFDKSMAFYLDNPVIFDDVYEAVIDTLNLRQQKLQKPKEEEREEEKEEAVPTKEVAKP